jgi:hypothetical protein
MKGSVFWDITPCSSFKTYLLFGEKVASIFGVEDYAKQETSMKQAAILTSPYIMGSHFSLMVESVRMYETLLLTASLPHRNQDPR